jgi:hypothetical protein
MNRLDDSIGQNSSSKLYGNALVALNHDLRDSGRSCLNSVLISAITLELFEVRHSFSL